MKFLIIQHEPETPAGSTLDFLNLQQIDYEVFRADQQSFAELRQNIDNYSHIIICGGSMNVDQTAQHPWLLEEKDWLHLALQKQKKILGLCLGSQLLAEALGGKVLTMPAWELGWHPIRMSDGSSLNALHWHHNEFTLPPGAQRVGSSELCQNQGFTYKNNILAFQFHPEVNDQWLDAAMEDDFSHRQGHVQSREQINALRSENIRLSREWYFKQLENFFELKKLDLVDSRHLFLQPSKSTEHNARIK